jgi:type IV secretory pathway TraG/TraD family ATPase VirD4
MAQWLVSAAQAAPGKGGEARFWSNLGEKLLSSLLFAAAASGRELTMLDVVSWMNRREVAEVERCLEESGDTLAREAWESSITRHEQTISSVYASVESVLAAYGDPEVLATTIGEGISGERLIESSGSVYVCAPPDEQERLAPLFAALVREVIAHAYDRYARTGRPLEPPLLVLLDEAGNIAPVPGLARLAATAASVGVQVVSVWQDLAQLHAVYGPVADTVLNNHRAKLVLSGVADERTVRWVRELLGEERRRSLSHTRGSERRTYTESTVERPLAPAWLTRQQRPGHGILVYGSLAPARVRLRPYFAERRLRALAEDGEPKQAKKRLARRQLLLRR